MSIEDFSWQTQVISLTEFYSVYTSIERCRIVPDLNIEWVMATASDAKGSLPMAVQKLGTPPAVVKDVGLFMGWIAKKRGFFEKSAPVAPVASVDAPS